MAFRGSHAEAPTASQRCCMYIGMADAGAEVTTFPGVSLPTTCLGRGKVWLHLSAMLQLPLDGVPNSEDPQSQIVYFSSNFN